jgi:hypothetical protein
MLDAINQRLFDLYTHVGGDLRLFALIDGVQTEQLTKSFPDRGEHTRALFDVTLGGASGDAGPWLMQVDTTSAKDLNKLDQLSASEEGMIWLISKLTFDELAAELTARLDVALADGTIALLHYYHPSVLSDLAVTLQPIPRSEFFAPAIEWLICRKTGLTLVHGANPTTVTP